LSAVQRLVGADDAGGVALVARFFQRRARGRAPRAEKPRLAAAANGTSW
jgi:hypothetical protein